MVNFIHIHILSLRLGDVPPVEWVLIIAGDHPICSADGDGNCAYGTRYISHEKTSIEMCISLYQINASCSTSDNIFFPSLALSFLCKFLRKQSAVINFYEWMRGSFCVVMNIHGAALRVCLHNFPQTHTHNCSGMYVVHNVELITALAIKRQRKL